MDPFVLPVLGILGLLVFLAFLPRLCGMRYIPHQKVGVIEKLWSAKGSLQEGRILALNGEAGARSRLCRNGSSWLAAARTASRVRP